MPIATPYPAINVEQYVTALKSGGLSEAAWQAISVQNPRRLLGLGWADVQPRSAAALLRAGACAGSSRLDQQALETPVVDRLSPSRCSGRCETYPWKPIEELLYRYHRLQTGEGSP